MSRTRYVAATALAAVLCLPSHAVAQMPLGPRPERPYLGLFGGNSMDPNSRQSLDLHATINGAYDDNVLADNGQGTGVDPRFQQGGGYGNAMLGVAYAVRGARGNLELFSGGGYRYAPEVESLTGFTYYGGFNFSARLGGRTTLGGSGRASRAPYYSFGLLPGAGGVVPGQPVVPIGFELIKRPVVNYYSSVFVDYRLSQRATLRADGNLRYVDFHEERTTGALKDWGAGARWSYRLSSRATAHIGYHYRKGTYRLYYGGRPIEGHDIDVGVDYARSLSFSRRTTFGFSTGSAVWRTYDPNFVPPAAGTTPPSLVDYRLRTQFMVTGSAYLNREIGRTWNARLDYRRGLNMIEGFPEPFFSDQVTFSADGQAGRRTRITTWAGYTDGAVGRAGNNDYSMYTATANVQVALTRWVALFGNYFYYRYEFDNGAFLPFGMSRGMSRNGVKVGVDLWAPLLR